MMQLPPDLLLKRDQLLDLLVSHQSCAVAFSAGVDSTVVAKAAALALGSRAVAITATSPSLAQGELEEAIELADRIGIRHVVIKSHEISKPEYVRNAPDRCYHCKTELYEQLGQMREELDVKVIVNGTNQDDWGDYRPGLRAADEHTVQSPLAECRLTKGEVRQLAEHWDLPVWNKPAMPCLASRIAYGEEVTADRMRMIDSAEQFLRDQGIREVRVRYHRNELARIEVPVSELARFADQQLRELLLRTFKDIGFQYVTLDLEGFRSGSLNAVLPLESLKGQRPDREA
jgi:uncharacterized protein